MSKTPHIGMITVQHRAFDDRIHIKQARSLRDNGYRLSMVHACADGKLKDMTGTVLATDPEGHLHTDGMDLYAITEPSGGLSSWAKKVYAGDFYRRMVQKAVSLKCDIYVAHEPQSIIIAARAAKETGATWTFDAHESLHFDNAKDKFAKRRWMSSLPSFTAANALTSAELAKMNPKAPYETILNASIFPTCTSEDRGPALLIHEGHFPWNRGLKMLTEALILLRRDRPDMRLRIVGEMKGEEAEYLEQKMNSHRLVDNVSISGWLDYMKVPVELDSASIGLILNEPTPNNLYGGPANKLFNYINAGLCVVSVDLPETTRIVKEVGCGIILEDRSPRTLAIVLDDLLEDKKRLMNYRRAAIEAAPEMHWNKESEKLVRFYNELLGI